jgi:hypothetical protein
MTGVQFRTMKGKRPVTAVSGKAIAIIEAIEHDPDLTGCFTQRLG